MGEIKRIPGGFTQVDQLPRNLRIYEPFYTGSNPLIPPAQTLSVFAVISAEDQNKTGKVYLLSENTPEQLSVVRSIVERCSGKTQSQQSGPLGTHDLYIAQIGNAKIHEIIKREFESRRQVDKQNKNIDAEAQKKINTADSLLKNAMELRASDIHIESDGHRAIVRFRIFKELIDYSHMSHQDAQDVCNIFFSTFVRGLDGTQEKGSGGGVYKSSNLLDGEFSRMLDNGVNMKARMVNIGQNNQGYYTMVLRLIDKSKAMGSKPFYVMGFSEHACSKMRILQRASRGMVLVGGVTGSGKSTSVQNMILQERDRTGNSRKIYTIEQPIEQTMARIIQVNGADSHEGNQGPNSSEQDFSFDNLNRMFMRGDPDTIAYGEIRDNKTAEAAIKGVESGHLVYGTMHVQNAMGVFSRFETFGVPLDKLCRNGFIKMVLFQHLVPKVCPHCSIPYQKNGKIPAEFGEFYAVKSFKTGSGGGLDMSKVIPIKQSLTPGESLIRKLQREKLISAHDAAMMKNRIDMMNSDNDTSDFQRRLDSLIESSTLSNDNISIKFRGDGCKHCFNGTVGVMPATEVLLPDEHFLELVLNGKINQAESYWKTKLGGRSVTSDMYPNILNGLVDPRMVESELEELGS